MEISFHEQRIDVTDSWILDIIIIIIMRQIMKKLCLTMFKEIMN